MRVVLDTNVLIRAFCTPAGPANELLQLVTAPPHDLLLSPFIIGELHRALRYDRVRALHRRDDAWIDERIAELQAAATIVSLNPTIVSAVVRHDPDDDPIVALAMVGHAARLATLDRHLSSPAVRAHCHQFGIEICSDVALLNELRGQTNS
jgi:putative PIN family toxin of toxin-antitoxin system